MSKITIAIADAQYLIRVGLRHLIEEFEQFEIIGEAGSEKELLNLLENHTPDIVILDYQQPENFDISSISKIKTVSPTSRILVISGDNEKENIYNVVQNGVSSFLTKGCDEEEIINAIKATAKKEKFFCNKILNFILEKSFSKPKDCCIPLSPREIEVVRLVVDGKIAKEIASQLNLSTHTIYTHRKNIMNKLELKSTSELVLYAVEKGIAKSPV
jgi:DNA-binding NarL/FixJ family response regulator